MRARAALIRCLNKLEHGELWGWQFCLQRLFRRLSWKWRRLFIYWTQRPPCRGVKFHSLTGTIDAATPTGRAMWQMIGVPADYAERAVMRSVRGGMEL